MTTMDDIAISGDDTQNVFGNTVSRDLVVNQFRYVRERRSMSLSESELTDRLAEYVPASNHHEIVERLRLDRAVGLCGPPGAGVATTAIAALRELQPGLEVRRFTVGQDDTAEVRPADAVGYLVRARDEDASRLRACAEAMRASGGFLLVVGTETDHRQEFADFLPPVRVLPPAADAVYRRRLAYRGLGNTAWPDWPRAAELLKDGSPGDARRLADIVRTVEREGGDEEDVVRHYNGWEDQLRGWFTAHREPRDRTLMIAAATISPADETSVYGAALSLARQLEVEAGGGGLVWCPSTGLGELLGVGAEEGRLVFRRKGYPKSVLRYVWRDYPLARTDLLTWLSALPTDDAVVLDGTLRLRVAAVFADLAAEHGAEDRIRRVAHAWAASNEADLAYVALSRTCLHPVVGGRVRRHLYEWSREKRAPQTLKLTIVRVSQMLGVTYPLIAMTRLKHLATLGNAEVRAEVADAVRELAQVHDDEVFTAVLGWCKAATRCSSGQDAVRLASVALRVLLDLAVGAGPPRLLAVLRAIERLGVYGGRLTPVALEAALHLASRHRAVVVRTALVWADDSLTGPGPRTAFGAALFVTLAAERDADGFAITLTGADAVNPVDSALAWHVALTAEAVPGDDVEDAARLWLDTALAHPGLRPHLVECFGRAVDGDLVQRRHMVDLVRAWARAGRDRRDLKEDVLVRLLHPEWKRLLLLLWVRARRAPARWSWRW